MEYDFQQGEKYTRRDVFKIAGLPADMTGGNWFTGYARHEKDWFIFANVGDAGRTGHDYQNRWVDDKLEWYGKTNSHKRQPSIESMLGSKGDVYIFTRESNRDSFTFVGVGKPAEVKDTVPVIVVWEMT